MNNADSPRRYANFSTLLYTKSVPKIYKHIPQTSTLLCFAVTDEFARFLYAKDKRQVNVFLKYMSAHPPTPLSEASTRMDTAK